MLHFCSTREPRSASRSDPPPECWQIGVIPARYESGRFPGKPLVIIMGKPMIVRTYLQARKSKSLDRLVVATDDERIAKVCKAAGADVVMTSSECANGQLFQMFDSATCICIRWQIIWYRTRA